MKPPSPLTAESDAFTNSGLPATAEDLIRLGAAMRLITFLDSPHLSGMSAEADFPQNQRPVGGSAQAARSLMQRTRSASLKRRLASSPLPRPRALHTLGELNGRYHSSTAVRTVLSGVSPIPTRSSPSTRCPGSWH